MAYTPNSVLRFGILGSPNLRKVIRAIDLAPNSTLHAVAGEPFDGLQDTVKIYGSYDEVLDNPDVDVVYVASVRQQWAVLAAQKKKHVLMETPTALDVGGWIGCWKPVNPTVSSSWTPPPHGCTTLERQQ
ncbi:hypothetical protein SLEP1_g30459 [Rubroshorea leprosula]|uniref:Gfo/Idh/MocA-like oxidoreductase N-terminal domain-containing protein n=1 Tax=Rubroshorea leprosula TaxID=152421 RepID=A0AAV5K694_9ROSI|nr:hypothetical protein SLEP1_g30459 [Rubroshorea leprosula]